MLSPATGKTWTSALDVLSLTQTLKRRVLCQTGWNIAVILTQRSEEWWSCWKGNMAFLTFMLGSLKQQKIDVLKFWMQHELQATMLHHKEVIGWVTGAFLLLIQCFLGCPGFLWTNLPAEASFKTLAELYWAKNKIIEFPHIKLVLKHCIDDGRRISSSIHPCKFAHNEIFEWNILLPQVTANYKTAVQNSFQQDIIQ